MKKHWKAILAAAFVGAITVMTGLLGLVATAGPDQVNPNSPRGKADVEAPAYTAENTDVTLGMLGTSTAGKSMTQFIVSGPSHGRLSAIKVLSSEPGSLTTEVVYTPDASYNGPDSFTFQCKDSDGNLSNVAIWSITVAPPPKAEAPRGSPPGGDDPQPDPDVECNSILETQNQALGEAVPVVGTPFRLYYHSARVPGRKAARSLEIPLSGEKVPKNLKRIDLEIFVAGQRLTQSFPPKPGQHTTFTWDGKDAQGRFVQGQQQATVRIGYVYDGMHLEAQQFGSGGTGTPGKGTPPRNEGTLWQVYEKMIGVWDARRTGLGGWSLDIHHSYDPVGKTLYLGYGQQRSSQNAKPIITTVVGTGKKGYGGDGGPAAKAQLDGPWSFSMAPDGTIYIADAKNHRIRRVGADGVITTVAGNGTQGDSGDGGPATKAQLSGPFGVSAGPDGSLYIADTNNHRIRRVGADGVITTVAGNGKQGDSGDGGLATKAQLNVPFGISAGPDGSLYIADMKNHRIRRVGADGVITTVAGNGTQGASGDGGPATKAQLLSPTYVTASPDGSLHIVDTAADCIRKVGSPFPTLAASETVIPDESGGQLHVFDALGRHLRTVNALTGAVLYQFEYDSANRFKAVRDRDGNITRIERSAEGDPTAIVAPFGQRTGLKLDSNGYLERVEPPGNNPTVCTYFDGGLLRTIKEAAKEKGTSFLYDDMGRLTQEEDAAGGFTELKRDKTEKGFVVSVMTALKPKPTTYRVETLPTGEVSRFNTCCCGAETKTVIRTDGSRKVTLPDGTIQTEVQQPDPRWGMQAPFLKTFSLTTPSGCSLTLSAERQVTLKEAANPLSLQTQTDRVTVNGKTYTSIFDLPKKQIRTRTPAGRESVVTLDNKDRIKESQFASLHPVRYEYDKGRLKSIAWGPEKEERSLSLKYDEKGRLESLTDPLQRTIRFTEFDDAGRVKKAVLPGNREIGFDYFPDGSLKSITPPGRPAHRFDYTAVNRLKSYQPPGAGLKTAATDYEYNKDRQLKKVTRPDGSAIDIEYDKVGRLDTITFPGNELKVGFDPKTDQLKTLATADGQTLTFDYDGFLVERVSWDGIVKGNVSYFYTKELRLDFMKINGGAPIDFEYDDPDGLLTAAGALTLKPDPKTGFLKETTLGKVTTNQEYNDFGEVKSFHAAFDDKFLLDIQYPDRDKLGRIRTKVEKIKRETNTYTYEYDDAGRLTDVTKNGKKVGHYEYDDNGNRILYEGPNGKVKGEPDEQDRLIHYGDATYGYTPSGELSTKTVNGKTTTYGYDAFGNLRTVSLPDGTKIEYVIDGANRRIGKKVNGKLVQGFLYAGELRPVAELDGENKVVSRFVYAGGINVPDYMEKDGKTYRLIKDHLGSPRLIIDAVTGEIAQRMDYDEFGNLIGDTNPGFQPFGFAGGLYDRQTGLTRFGARDYDAQTGRWTAKDPIGFASRQSNFYVYVMNDPINLRDLSGLGSGRDWLCGAGAIALAEAAVKGAPAWQAKAIIKILIYTLGAICSGRINLDWLEDRSCTPDPPPSDPVDMNPPMGVNQDDQPPMQFDPDPVYLPIHFDPDPVYLPIHFDPDPVYRSKPRGQR